MLMAAPLLVDVAAHPPDPPWRPPPATLEPATWAALTYGGVALGDARRTARLVATMSAVAAQPTASLPQQLRAPAALKATYRLLHEADVSAPAILDPHLTATRAAAQEQPLVLFVQDASHLDYSAHRATTGLGPLGDGRKQGLILQSALAVLPADGTVLGLAASEVFARVPAPRQGERTEERQQRPRESDVWARLVEQIGPPPPGVQWVHVADRGSDVFTFFAACRAQGTQVLLRAAQDRCITTEDGELDYLCLTARDVVMQDSRPFAVPARPKTSKHPARTARTTTLAIAWTALTVEPPFHTRQQEPLPAWVIHTWERDPPPEEPEPLEWILLTTVPTTTVAEAWERVDWYTRRWLVEDFHQALKTGCRMEQTQLRDGTAIMRLVGMLSPVAVRLLQLRHAARTAPQQPATAVVEARVVQVVAHLTGQAPALTCGQFWRSVARLGGHQGRTGDGDPGWRTVWRGWQYVATILRGVELAADLPPPKRCG
jgi:hypothetical protein